MKLKVRLMVFVIFAVVLAGIIIWLISKEPSVDKESLIDIDEVIQTFYPRQMVLVKAGTFMMGNTRNDSEGSKWEKPVHEVALTYDYEIGKYEVMNTEFLEFLNEAWVSSDGKLNGNIVIDMDSDYCSFVYTSSNKTNEWFTLSKEYTKNHPVHSVTWWGGIEYCNWLSEKKGLTKAYDKKGNLLDKYGNKTEDISEVEGYRLPTEAEWEYAARGGHKSRGDYKYAGSNNIDTVAWYEDNSNGETHGVSRKKQNELGLYDMSGNVREWCQDYYSTVSNFYKKSPRKNPVNLGGIIKPLFRVFRGGCWGHDAEDCRVASRYSHSPGYSDNGVGLRIARTKK